MARSLSSRATIAFVALCLAIGLLVRPVQAEVTISAAPSLLEVSATPGGVGSQDITVTNAGSEPFNVSAEVVQYKGAEGSLSAVSWLKVEPASFDLAPNQRAVVKVSITVPADAESGGRYATVAFRTGGKPGAGSGVGVAAQVGVPFLITVKGAGALARQPSLDSLVPVLEPDGSLGFRAGVTNRGNVHFYARGIVDVADASGKPWGRLELRETTAILPGTSELLYSDQPILFKDGATYRARATVSFGEGSPEVKEIEFGASAALRIEDVAPRTTPAGELDVRVRLKNSGTLGLLPRVVMAIRRDDGKVVGVLSPNQDPLVWPAQGVEVNARYPGRLPPGKYALVARAEYGAFSVQQEAPFEIGSSTAQAAGSVPVSQWAGAAPKQPQEVASSPPIIPDPVRDIGSLVASALTGLLPLATLALIGILLTWYWRNPQQSPPRPRLPLALPSPAAIGSGLVEQLRRRQRRHATYSHYSSLATLPPPPLHLLPPPREESKRSMHRTKQSAMDLGAAFPRMPSSGSVGGEIDAAEPASPPEPATKAGRPEQRAKTRLARAVSEKAAALVDKAERAARRGDKAAVDRLSRQALKLDPWNIDAWLWLAASCEDAHSTRMCLKAVLLLDPTNVRAKRGLASLGGGLTEDGGPDESRGEATGDGQRHDVGATYHPAG